MSVVVKIVHALTKTEVALLQRLPGQLITSISGRKVDANCSSGLAFDEVINLQLSGGNYLAITGAFDETKLGDDFIKIKVTSSETPKHSIHATGTSSELLFKMAVQPHFRISSVEVYGYNYQISSNNDQPAPYWQILKGHPAQSVTEQIKTENILLFHATDQRRFLVKPLGPVPRMVASFEDALIDQLLLERNKKGAVVTKLKMHF